MQNEIVWESVEGKTDDDMVSCVEKILDIKFPEEYLECVRKYPGGWPSPSFFTTAKATTYQDTTGGGDFEYLLSFDPNFKANILNEYYMMNHHSENANKLPDKVVPFANANGNHDSLCFDYRQGFPPKIVLFDLEKHWEYLDDDEFRDEEIMEEDYLIYVCDSFNELLDMLTKSPEE